VAGQKCGATEIGTPPKQDDGHPKQRLNRLVGLVYALAVGPGLVLNKPPFRLSVSDPVLVTTSTRIGHSPVAASASMTMLRMLLRTSRSPVLEGRSKDM
jgi:hypothetical protein